MNTVAAALLLVGTLIHMGTSIRDLGQARKREIDWWSAEEELVAEIPSWRWNKRRRIRRELRSWRAPELDREIQHMIWVSWGWLFLALGAATAVGITVF